MILKALYEYYQRHGGLAQIGAQDIRISFVVVVKDDGSFVRVEDRREDNQGQLFRVAKAVDRASGIAPNKFWDNIEYTLCYCADAKKEEKTRNKHQAFIDLCEKISKAFPNNKGMGAVCRFYKNGGVDAVKGDEMWQNMIKIKNAAVNVSFLLEGQMHIVAESKEIFTFKDDFSEKVSAVCLVTGNNAIPVKLTTATPIAGSQAKAKLVAFQVSSGYDSYGKEQGDNAPISEEAEFAYTTALNHLLKSRNKKDCGGRTMVFWASADDDTSQKAEEGIFALLGIKTDDDDPDRNIENVRQVYKSIYSGALSTTTDDKFYFLGLAPNAARIAVVYWKETPLKDFAGEILRHFDDMDIVDTRKEKKSYSGLYQILSNVTLQGKAANVQPNLPEAVIKSIIEGIPYPYTLFAACMRRITAEQKVTIGRAAIIKAYLNRLNQNNKKITTMLDKQNDNQGYLCGRLFATLEKLQERSNGSSNLAERYMNAACATPAVVFPTILNLSVHHLQKLDGAGGTFYEKTKTEIISKLSADGFPTNLDLNDQGRFMVGYYHQMQYFYTPKGERDNE